MKSKLLEAGLDPTQVKYIQEVEASIIKRVEDILAPIVGPGNARVQIAADIDFSQANRLPRRIDRTRRRRRSVFAASRPAKPPAPARAAQGVPGALSNQPPVPATAPADATRRWLVPAPPPRPASGTRADQRRRGAGAIAASANHQHQQELDDQLRGRQDHPSRQAIGRHDQAPVGAVVVNQRKEIGKDGKTGQQAATGRRTETDQRPRQGSDGLQQGSRRHHLGRQCAVHCHRKGRGPAAWRDPEMLSLAKDLIKYGALAGILAYLLLGVVRPLLKTMLRNRELPSEAASAAASTCLPAKKAKAKQEHAPTAAELLEKQTRQGARAGAAR
jgi:flagellar M-ring protein FliF